MFNRASVIDQAFSERVLAGNFPVPRSPLRLADTKVTALELIELFESQAMSRNLDLLAREMRAANEGFYTIGSSGHEGNAAFGKVFRISDPAFLHYRSGAFMMQRYKQLVGATAIYDQILSLAAAAEDPIAGGRHKVFGSRELNVPPQTSTIASHLPKAVGAALGLGRSPDLGSDVSHPPDACVICSFGDASLNHSTAQGAINCAGWIAHQNIPLPLIFVVEDNGIGISVKSPPGWVEAVLRSRPGWRYFACDGRDILDCLRAADEAEEYVRRRRRPAFIHMKTVRLLGHAGSDVESSYNPMSIIEQTEADDPLLHSARILVQESLLTPHEVVELYQGLKRRMRRIAAFVAQRPKLLTAEQIMASIIPPSRKTRPLPAPGLQSRQQCFGAHFRKLAEPQHMARLLNWALTDIMLQYPQAMIFGEDVAQKGGVYNVTTGLCDRFGPKRVFNSLLDEQSILGTAIGLAQTGFLPIPEIQFLAYVHNAEDQIRGEAATLSFFSQGQFTNPMVIRIAGLAYQKGFGGHFHNDNSLAVFRDLPGVIVACPARGDDAVRMLRTCVRLAYEQQRVVVFVEPIALYMTRDLYQPGDGEWLSIYPDPEEEIAFGRPGVYGEASPHVVLTYGNGVPLSLQAVQELLARGQNVRVIDLRWLHPLPEAALQELLHGVEKVLIVDECRRSGSLSEGLFCFLAEEFGPQLQIRREVAFDSFIPLGVAATATLPSVASIRAAAETFFTQGHHVGQECQSHG